MSSAARAEIVSRPEQLEPRPQGPAEMRGAQGTETSMTTRKPRFLGFQRSSPDPTCYPSQCHLLCEWVESHLASMSGALGPQRAGQCPEEWRASVLPALGQPEEQGG